MSEHSSEQLACYMASIGIDNTNVIQSYFDAYIETGDINLFAIATYLVKFGLENELENIEEFLKTSR